MQGMEHVGLLAVLSSQGLLCMHKPQLCRMASSSVRPSGNANGDN